MFRKGDTEHNSERLAMLLTSQGNAVEEIGTDPVILNVYDGDIADDNYLFTLTLSVTE